MADFNYTIGDPEMELFNITDEVIELPDTTTWEDIYNLVDAEDFERPLSGRIPNGWHTLNLLFSKVFVWKYVIFDSLKVDFSESSSAGSGLLYFGNTLDV